MNASSRRTFLMRSVAMATASLSPTWLSRSVYANPSGRPVGLQLYAVNSMLQADPEGTLKAVKEIGFGEVETAGFGRLTAKEFRRLLDDNGLMCPSAHLAFDLANLGPTFETAHALGVHYVTSSVLRTSSSPSSGLGAGMTLDQAKQTAELANKIGEKSTQAGFQFTYHNHHVEFADQGGSIGYDVLLRETDPELVKFEIDCGWMVVGGRNPIDYFKRYPKRFPMIHVKDFLPPRDQESNAGPEHPGAELGHGIIDYPPIFAAAEKAGVQHYFAEQEGPFARMSQLDAAREAYAYLHALK